MRFLGQAAHEIRDLLDIRTLFRSDSPGARRWDDPVNIVRFVVFILVLSVGAGIALRLAGYVGGAYSWFFLSDALDDSWYPMGLAYDRITGTATGTLHDLFFEDHVKFQYPASSLLIYSALDFVGITPAPGALNVFVWLSVLAMPFLIFQMCLVYIRKYLSATFTTVQTYLVATGFAVSTLFFYPIMIAWRLGQVQAFLNLAFVLACLLWLYNKRIAAGALIGLSCLIKPQFSLFLLWSLLRRQNKFAAGQTVVLCGGLLLSLALYGWAENIYYLDVLSYISRHGEVFWDNSTVNGLVNGLVHPDETLIFDSNGFPAYHVFTHVMTLATSLLMVGYALSAARSSSTVSLLSFMIAGLTFTIASPIAWGHHYGIVMPILAIGFLEILRLTRGTQRRNYLIAWSFSLLLFSNNWNVSEELAGTWLSVLQGWRLFAGLVLLFVLYRLQAIEVEASDQSPARGAGTRGSDLKLTPQQNPA